MLIRKSIHKKKCCLSIIAVLLAAVSSNVMASEKRVVISPVKPIRSLESYLKPYITNNLEVIEIVLNFSTSIKDLDEFNLGYIKNLSNLKGLKITIFCTELRDGDLEFLEEMNSLERFEFFSDVVSKKALRSYLNRCEKLREISLYHPSFVSDSPEEFLNFINNLKNIETVYINEKHINSKHCQLLEAECPDIQILPGLISVFDMNLFGGRDKMPVPTNEVKVSTMEELGIGREEKNPVPVGCKY